MAVTISGTSGLTANGSVFTDASGNTGIGTASPIAQSQLTVASKSLSVTGSDGNFSLGGNRALVDVGSGAARFAAVAGGGAALPLSLLYGPASGGSIEAARLDTSGNFLFNSGYGSVATSYGCRAWVNFNATPTIAASGNVTSITKNGTGDFTVNFTNAMPDANYSAQYNTRPSSGAIVDICNISSVAGPTTTTCRVFSGQSSNGAGRDPVVAFFAVFR